MCWALSKACARHRQGQRRNREARNRAYHEPVLPHRSPVSGNEQKLWDNSDKTMRLTSNAQKTCPRFGRAPFSLLR
jgi:hypothetical protein